MSPHDALTPSRLRALRWRAQCLDAPARHDDPARLLTAVCGVQAQEPAAAALAARARTRGLTAAAVEQARVETRAVVRTWAMRGTLHLLASDDLGWLLPILGPPAMRASERRRAALGLDAAATAHGVKLLRHVLAERGPLTRAEIVAALAPRGVALPGQAAPHLIGYAALAGVICCGPDRGREPTYVLLADWVRLGDPLPREAALGELVHRYLAAFGPATPHDAAQWAGLPLADVREGFRQAAARLIEIPAAGGTLFLPRERAPWLAEDAGPGSLRLLPRFDPYLLGYRGRDLAVEERHARRIHPGGGMILAAMAVGGLVTGTWRTVRRRGALQIAVTPFTKIATGRQDELAAEAADIGRFLDLPATLTVTPPES